MLVLLVVARVGLKSSPSIPASQIVVTREAALPLPRNPSNVWPMLRRIFAAEADESLHNMLPDAPCAADPLPCDWRDFARLRSELEAAGFSPFTQRDLELSEALNVGYLLRLNIVPSLSRTNESLALEFYGQDHREDLPFGGRVLLFHRGYTTENSTGRLIIPKLDYLQASHLN